MALNWQTFRTRALTAIVFVAVMLSGLLWNHWSFLLLFTIIHFGCWWEYFNLLERIHRVSFNPFVRQGFMLLGFGAMLLFCRPIFHIGQYGLRENLSLPVSAAGTAMLIIGIFQTSAIRLKAFGAAALGLLYISLSWALLLDLYQQEITLNFKDTSFVVSREFLPVLIIASIWINDTMAYIVGSFIGKTPLSAISPKKTWEGTIGGIILSIVVMSFLFPLLFYGQSSMAFVALIAPIATLASAAGTFGDLLESKLKRMAGVKDSGRIMPGHGGFLDRFDSLLLAIPIVWLFVKVIVFEF